jgi:hypothetical protein
VQKKTHTWKIQVCINILYVLIYYGWWIVAYHSSRTSPPIPLCHQKDQKVPISHLADLTGPCRSCGSARRRLMTCPASWDAAKLIMEPWWSGFGWENPGALKTLYQHVSTIHSLWNYEDILKIMKFWCGPVAGAFTLSSRHQVLFTHISAMVKT